MKDVVVWPCPADPSPGQRRQKEETTTAEPTRANCGFLKLQGSAAAAPAGKTTTKLWPILFPSRLLFPRVNKEASPSP